MSVIELDREVGFAADGMPDIPGAEPKAAGPAPRKEPTPREAKKSILLGIPFWGVHVAALAVFFVDFHWAYVALFTALYFVRMFAVTAGYHRYFSHRTFKTSRPFQFVIAWMGSSCMQKGVLWWAAHHRKHHRHSDQPEDIHSPTLRGFFWSHVGWILASDYEETDWPRIRDFARYPELVWLNKWHLVPGVVLFVAIWAVWGWGALAWTMASQVALWHGTFTINSLSHVFGKVRYKTTDTSKNNWFLALVTMGEGWHNNHHYYPASANQGFFWWEVDMSYYVLKGLQAVGLIWDVKNPPKHVLEGNRVDRTGAEPTKPAPFAEAA